MKRLHLFCLFACISLSVKAQNVQNPCNSEYSVAVSLSDKLVNGRALYADVKWDFSNVVADAQINIEVVPIADCWENLNASQFRPTKLIPVNAQHRVSQAEVGVLETMGKCFKWRSVIVSSNCTETSDWKFFSFMTNK